MHTTAPGPGLRRSALQALAAMTLAGCLALLGAPAAAADAPGAPSPAALVLGTRTVLEFRAAQGEYTPAERADSARARILRAFEGPGEGWTSVRVQGDAAMVELDGKPMFSVLPGDVPDGSGATAQGLANAASRALQTSWGEARERRDPRAVLSGLSRALGAAFVLGLALVLLWRATRWLRDAVATRLTRGIRVLPEAGLASRMSPLAGALVTQATVLLSWVASGLLVYVFVVYALDQFAYTRSIGEGLFQAFSALLLQGLGAMAQSLPGLFVAVVIFLVARVLTQVSAEVFSLVASGRLKLGLLDAHTAPATRHIVNACLWLFALAMAYPYLPGAQTDAFKGLSVILGVMVSIGASGVVGQVASGVILVYTRALSLGEYVRIQDAEGTVTEIGLFVTRLRTGLGTEVALPNALVLGNVTVNHSRGAREGTFVHGTTVTIGYDTPWRQVHALLEEAARAVPAIATEPAPYVSQTALSDFYVEYRLVAQVRASDPAERARATSALRAAILDTFNRYGVQIMSPGYYDDPAQPKVVPPERWYEAPARRPVGGPPPAG
jgi:small-conductance mechanosensitive channel